MNGDPFLASTLVPWTVNGPTALPHGDALAEVVPRSPSGKISATTSNAASTRAAPRASPRQPNRPPARAHPAGVTDPFHVATGKLPPVPHGRREESSCAAIG